MDKIFDDVWSDIKQRLMPGTLIRNWSAEEGYMGGAFSVDDVDSAGVIIRFGQVGRRVSRRDFENLFAFWAAYNRGTIGRSDLAKRSDNAIYILSILNWRDETQTTGQSAPPASHVAVPLRADGASATGVPGRDEYGMKVLYDATEGRVVLSGPSIELDYGAGPPARIAATVGDIAVEIEPGRSKQVRGAVLDLICHPFAKKLLVLLPDHLTNTETTAEQCRNIMRRFCPVGSFRVLVLKGSGSFPLLAEDSLTTASVLTDLRSS